jgi:glyoxylase-like metal-dependent hydrolase (beta-lactamase superfamily II)
MQPTIKSFYHHPTYTWTHVVSDPETGKAAIIDPVLDYDGASAHTSTESVDEVLNYVKDNNLDIEYVLETHAHADHITAAKHIQETLKTPVIIGDGIKKVQKTFKPIYNLGAEFTTDGSQFDRLMHEGDVIKVGNLELKALHTPGHTNDSMSYVVGDNVFIGDTLFAPDYGTARCDFPGGDAGKLYDSIQKLYALGDDVVMHLCHDYPPEHREPQSAFTVAEQKKHNVHVHEGVTREEFIALRTARDKTLAAPRLIIPSIQVNIKAGNFPEPEGNGMVYLKTPLNTF